MDVVIQGSTSQQKLCANVAAQIMAFACGKQDANPNKSFDGGRPSSIIIGHLRYHEDLGTETWGCLSFETVPFMEVTTRFELVNDGFAERRGNPPENAENPRRRQGFRVACGFSKLR